MPECYKHINRSKPHGNNRDIFKSRTTGTDDTSANLNH